LGYHFFAYFLCWVLLLRGGALYARACVCEGKMPRVLLLDGPSDDDDDETGGDGGALVV
jgi:hypothetical protein